MKLVRGAWKLLVGIKDALVLVAMLLFFAAIFAALNARQRPATIGDGALVLELDGPIVEQPEEVPLTALLSGQRIGKQYRLRDVLRAIDTARDDDRVKAIVVDLDRFGGGYPAVLGEVQAALLRARTAGKPVLVYATAYTDGAYRIASAGSEIWTNTLGGTMFAGPGGNQLFYKGLIDKLGINAHVYRVGKFKSAVEPYTRTDQSPAAREASQALYGALFDQWREAVSTARPRAQLASWLTNPAQLIAQARGDVSRANLATGLVDKLGDRVAFNRRVAQLAGGDEKKPAGWFRTIGYDAYVAANPVPAKGKIGVLTIAGEIVDGEGGPGKAAGDTVSKLLYDGLAENDLKALVVRVDSPGGSVMASEKIRLAIMEAKRRGLPIVVSMGGLAASGGYWVSTPADVIFAEPGTITGSIGIFGIIPTFENTLAKIGLSTDGVKTTPLSGQPDVLGGTTPALDSIVQAGIEHGYLQFLTRVSQSRKLPIARVDEIGQGRVWIGGVAHQLKLVDRFGGLDDALREAAKRAKLDDAQPVWLEKKPGFTAQIAQQISNQDDDDAGAPADALSRLTWQRQQAFAAALGDAKRMLTGAAVRVQCLECVGLGPIAARAEDRNLWQMVVARVGL
ncbi:signal peptide peptidase SppA [Sphingomonas sp. Leaf231]|uniref:signal peptide peptidase SppA n=1 Tax=Sphingomonas sp. Leaf231 TaxID=1736301 RepID=UPI0006FBABDC|nr:signal peptide peptidase SppA [Sphingomonas sp. Leaf231]KQN93634.1 signal peptide peptidase SppA [Sphingomonas sp. Leaf231]